MVDILVDAREGTEIGKNKIEMGKTTTEIGKKTTEIGRNRFPKAQGKYFWGDNNPTDQLQKPKYASVF